jgi:hypothetical protein
MSNWERYSCQRLLAQTYLTCFITGVDDSFQFDKEAVPTEEEKLKKES